MGCVVKHKPNSKKTYSVITMLMFLEPLSLISLYFKNSLYSSKTVPRGGSHRRCLTP